MNKRILTIMCIMVSVMVLAGCGMVRRTNNDLNTFENNTLIENETTEVEFVEIEIDEDIFGEYSGSQASMMMSEPVTLYGGYYIFTTFSHSTARTYMLDGDYNAHLFCLDDSCNHTGHCTSKLFSIYPMQYYKGELYFAEQTAIYKMDGNKRKLVYNNMDYLQCFCIRDDKMYYTDDNGICSVDMNTKEKVYLTELMCAPFSLNVYNDKIYFASDSYQLYSMNFDGSELTLLSDDFGFIPQCHNGKLYYRNMSGKSVENDTLVELDLSTGDKRVLATNVYHIRVCNDAIYYCEWFDENHLCSLKKYIYEKDEIQELGKIEFTNFMVFDEIDYIVAYDIETYMNGPNKEKIYKPYIMDKDGKNKKMIELPKVAIE